MIKVRIFRNQHSHFIYGFKTEDHGESLVCAAVSTLCINAVNSIEAFTELDFTCDVVEEGGFLDFNVPEIEGGGENHDADLLLKSMLLGLSALVNDYPDEISIIDKEVQA